MRRIREALRLHLQGDLSYNEVGRVLKISKRVVGKYVSLARVAGVDCAVADGLTDDELEARLYRPALARSSYQLAPDFGVVHQELKRPGVTLMLLWEEYASANPLAYKYTSFCVKYREFAKAQQRSMRQVHVAGEKLFVDYAGDTVPIVDATTGEITRAQIFVAVLGASNYTFACATPRQTTADWIDGQMRRVGLLVLPSTRHPFSAGLDPPIHPQRVAGGASLAGCRGERERVRHAPQRRTLRLGHQRPRTRGRHAAVHALRPAIRAHVRQALARPSSGHR